jgi:hypothetical protein
MFPSITDREGNVAISPVTAAIAGTALGLAVGATAMASKKLDDKEQDGD